MIPSDTVDRILASTKVEEVIGDFVTLKRQGANYLACCPFHNEKTPSFSVSPSKGFYYCFGCHKGGSAITFLMEHEAMSYVDALRWLARKYNIEVVEEEESAEDIALKQRKESLFLVSDFAQNFFTSNLEAGEGRSVGLAYFRSRGLEDETIRKFGLGWCPSDSKALYNAAHAAGFKDEYLIDSGLCIRTEEGRIYDRFHERVMFPFHSLSGRVIGFNGRTLRSDKHVGKYVNSPETEIYVKSRFLYGMWFAKTQISKLDKCILVEGNLDMISMHQLGLTNVVASCGTALTQEQIRLIKRFTSNVTIIYDGDAAGIHAALRGINLVLAEGLNVKIVLLPDGQDPDDFCKSHSLAEVEEYIASSEKDLIAFKSDLLLEEAADDPLKKANLINDIADTIAYIPDPVKRATYTESCALRFEMSRTILADRVENTRARYDEEERKRYVQQKRQEAAAAAGLPAQSSDDAPSLPGEYGDYGGYVPANAQEYREENVRLDGAVGMRRVPLKSPLEPSERALLEFILKNGCDKMLFSDDSPYYTAEPMTVAGFIDSSLSADNVVFDDPCCRAVYDGYFCLYDEGLEQEEIVRRLIAGEDRAVSGFVVETVAERHEVTERHLRDSITKISTLLLQEVPKAILNYHVKMVEKQVAELQKSLASPGADVMEVMGKIKALNEKRNEINKILGRI